MYDLKSKMMIFAQALLSVYNDDEGPVMKLELPEKDLTEDITAMIYAVHAIIDKLTGVESDNLDFIALCNRLTVMQLLESEDKKETK